MLGMIISWISSSLSIQEPRSRSQWLFLEKHCHRFSALIYNPISINLHTHIGYYYTSNKFQFQRDRVKVKVAVTVFRKTLQLKACQASKGKNLTSSFIFIRKGYTVYTVIKYMATKLFNSFKNSFCLLWK